MITNKHLEQLGKLKQYTYCPRIELFPDTSGNVFAGIGVPTELGTFVGADSLTKLLDKLIVQLATKRFKVELTNCTADTKHIENLIAKALKGYNFIIERNLSNVE